MENLTLGQFVHGQMYRHPIILHCPIILILSLYVIAFLITSILSVIDVIWPEIQDPPDSFDPLVDGDDEAVDDLPLLLPRLQPVQLVVKLVVHNGHHMVEFGQTGCRDTS